MKYYFFDASALVKRYHEEKGTKSVDKIFDSKDKVILISSLTIVEIVSAFNKKKNRREITKTDFEFLVSRFFSDALENFVILELEDLNIKKSIELVLKHNLRTLDSIQLSSAISLKRFFPIFVCSDVNLCKAAKKEKLKIKNPEKR